MLITPKKLQQILSLRLKDDTLKNLKDLPHPHTLKDCELAGKICAQHIEKSNKIVIVGDYDVDGTMSIVIMMNFFGMLGYKNVQYVIPNRFHDGYGISKEIISRHQDANLIITVDNGIAAFEASQYCEDHGIDLIITDHHNPQDSLPKASAIINPKQKNCDFAQKDICGGAVAWYFCNAIKIALNQSFSLQPLLKYVMLATIADMMPLTHLNKIFVKKGIEQFIASQQNADLLLKTLLRGPINAYNISFEITPMLNSAGRMQDASLVCEFFLSDKEGETAEIFNHLRQLNLDRKTLTTDTYNLALASLREGENYVLSLGENFHDGVIGIVAARLSETYLRPAFVFTQKEDGNLKGSGRSDGRIDIFQTLLPFQENFLHFGGHSQAVGITLSKEVLEKFGNFFAQYVPLENKEEDPVLGILTLDSINEELLGVIQSFEPYGQGNQIPKFMLRKLRVTQSKKIKDLHQNLEFNHRIWGVDFFSKRFYEVGEFVNVICSLALDSRHQTSLQLHSISPYGI